MTVLNLCRLGVATLTSFEIEHEIINCVASPIGVAAPEQSLRLAKIFNTQQPGRFVMARQSPSHSAQDRDPHGNMNPLDCMPATWADQRQSSGLLKDLLIRKRLQWQS